MIEFLQDNWLFLAVAAYAAWSELMSLHPKWQSNGVLHFLTLFVGKLLGGRK